MTKKSRQKFKYLENEKGFQLTKVVLNLTVRIQISEANFVILQLFECFILKYFHSHRSRAHLWLTSGSLQNQFN